MGIKDIIRQNIKTPEGRFERFDLLRYFTISSIGIFIILTIVLGLVFVNFQKNLLIDYAKTTTSSLATQLSRRLIAEGLVNTQKSESGISLEYDLPDYHRLDTIVRTYLTENTEIVKVKIYDKHGVTIYSTVTGDIGVLNIHDNLKKALAGEMSSELTERMQPLEGETTEEGRLYDVDLLEIYVPIYGSKIPGLNEMEIIGAFEVYKNVSVVFNKARMGGMLLFILFTLSMCLLFFILLWIVRKADRTIRKINEAVKQYNMELEEAQHIVADSIDEVIRHGSFHVRSVNENLLKCWEHKKCDKKNCPSHGAANLRCWQVAGTFCGGEVQGFFANKYGDCRKCDVYMHAFNNRINTISESFNNMMALLESKHIKLKELNEQLNRLIDIDPLTQVGNRRNFQNRMENMHLLSLRYKHPYSIIICDVDYFKPFNDNYGHQQGDYALITVAKTLKDNLRKTDEIFRWGGEEFVILLHEQGLPAALKVAENLRMSIEELNIPHAHSEFRILTMSFGVSANTNDKVKYISWETVLKEADNQMYRAKSEGRNQVYPITSKEETGLAK